MRHLMLAYSWLLAIILVDHGVTNIDGKSMSFSPIVNNVVTFEDNSSKLSLII